MVTLECKNCENKEMFIATCVYKYEVNSNGENITDLEMDEEPEYECKKCGSPNIKIDVLSE
ncbi:MAG: hypothetical protein HY752_01185 [Nitrospirae bacterium]|nr:hypothetical protein [Nitrospirota bacterium]